MTKLPDIAALHAAVVPSLADAGRGLAAFAAAGARPTRQCGHDGCTATATHQHQRPATEAEATAHFDALEANIIASGNPDYVHNRNDTVTIAEHRCDQHKPQ